MHFFGVVLHVLCEGSNPQSMRVRWLVSATRGLHFRKFVFACFGLCWGVGLTRPFFHGGLVSEGGQTIRDQGTQLPGVEDLAHWWVAGDVPPINTKD